MSTTALFLRWPVLEPDSRACPVGRSLNVALWFRRRYHLRMMFGQRPASAVCGGSPGSEDGSVSSVSSECRFAVTLPAEKQSTGELRRAVREHAGWWGLTDCSDAVLVASELFANAVEHGSPSHGTVDVEVKHQGGFVWIAVTDRRPDRVPVRRAATADAESGRGVVLLDELATVWATTIDACTKTVWAQVPVNAA
ncbi:ATP-binding protein [Streptomyces sp. NBC_01803]|uniref:ATP-binding protein n=1 Tax=Streptomyces sp. NBC_01803 TaxID=2975946 RepID=UPI002DDB42B6|nr:ATP-binding protein [Streptomyces sp. NBC_01803]WSA46189.1 ATP-binding protein [Streptomyces sp. NBC_01803]